MATEENSNGNSNDNENNNDNSNDTDSLYKINKDRFWTRAHALHSSWTNHLKGIGDPNWQSCDSILVICGKNDNIPFKKNNSLHLWLFGIQLLSSIMIITPDTIHVCCGDKTLNVLSVLGESNGDLKLNFIIKDKSNGYESNYKTLIEILKSTNTGKSIGYMNESQAGKFVKNFVNLVIQDNGDENKNDQNGNSNNNNFEIIDYSSALSSLTMIKDDYELSIMKRVGEFASNMFVYSRNKIEKIVERDQTKKHNEIAEELIQFLDNSEKFDKLLNKNKSKNSLTSHASFKKDNLEVCYQPVIQSGGKFKLKIKETSESDEQQLYYNGGCVVVMIGFKLKDYCVNIGRTLYFDATKEQKEIYNVLLKAFKKGLITLRNNVQLSNVYNAALKVVKAKKPELEKNFLKNCGWGIGLELRDKNYVIDKKSTMVARTGMTFNFQVGFQNLVDAKKAENGDDKASHYSVIIADTVIVTEGQMEWITKCDRHITDYEIGDPNEVKENDNSNSNGKSKKKDKDKEKEKEKSKEGQSSKKRKKSKSKKDKDNENDNDDDDDDGSGDDDVGTSSNNNKSNDLSYEAAAGRRYVTRHSNAEAQKKREENQKARQEREKNQEKLRELKRKRLDKLFRETGGDLNNKVEEKEYKDPNCYNDSSHLPSNLNNGQLHVDFKNECLICPIMDHMVPFHVSTIKNYSLQQHHSGQNDGAPPSLSPMKHRNNGDNWTYLRINFVSTVAQHTSRRVKQPLVSIQHPDAMFIKELSYRSMGNNLATVSEQIKLLQKQIKQKEKQANDTPLIKQDKLIRAKSRQHAARLTDLSVRPSLGGIRKKNTGVLECHHNGLRYMDHKKNEIHILFNNVKCAFFQPAKNTPAVLIHFHLKNAIMIGKKPSTDVQCYRDVIDRFEDIGRSNYDYDGIQAEREERRRIQTTNKEFRAFVQKVEKLSKENSNGEDTIEFEIPEMDLEFEGVPNKQAVKMYPTGHCLIGLEDNPPFVLCTKDIELAHFERVDFSLKNFDLAFVFKDYNKEPIKVATIPRNHLDTLQDFLNWQNVMYSQGKANLDWKEVMKNIRENLEEFIDNGGWDFLREEELAYQGTSLSPTKSDKSESHGSSDKNGKKSKKSKKKSRKGDDEDFYDMDEQEWRPPSDDDDYSDEYSDDYYSNEGSDAYSDEYSDEYSDDDDDGYGYEDDEEQGMSWDELEKKAIQEDKQAKQRERNDEFMQSREQRPNKRRKR